MILGVVGSRDFKDLDMVDKWVRTHASRFTEMVSGGARGVDKTAAKAWEEVTGKKPKVFKADWDRYPGYAGYIRNVRIVNTADFLAVFWDASSGGTLDDIGLTLVAGKPMNVYVRP